MTPCPTLLLSDVRVLIRGAGDLATGVAHRLFRAGLRPALTEIAAPLAVRRAVCFSEAVFDGEWEVEGVRARLIADSADLDAVRVRDMIPVLVDRDLDCVKPWAPHALVDATLTKRNYGLRRDLAPLVVGLGPGFTAGDDVDRVVETNRGHNLGRIYESGAAEPNTGVPGDTAGFSVERVVRAPCSGRFTTTIEIGDMVRSGQVLGQVDASEVHAGIDGIVRGLLRSDTQVTAGLKLGDVDPRGLREHCFTISEKARAIGGAVLETVIASLADEEGAPS